MIRAILTSGSMRSLRHKPDRSCAPKPGHIACHRHSSILKLLSVADAATLRRVVLAPETSCRLPSGHTGGCDSRDFWRFLIDALEVEYARLSRGCAQSL